MKCVYRGAFPIDVKVVNRISQTGALVGERDDTFRYRFCAFHMKTSHASTYHRRYEILAFSKKEFTMKRIHQYCTSLLFVATKEHLEYFNEHFFVVD